MLKGRDNKMVTSRNYLGPMSRTLESRDLETRATFSAGDLFPIYMEEVYPASNKKVLQKSFVRSITPLGPVMDHSFLDVMFFFVPYRLLWDHWEEFIAGYNKEAWAQDVEYTVPQIKFKLHENPGVNHNAYIGSALDHIPGCCDVVELHSCESKLRAIVDQEGSSLTVADAEDLLNNMFGISALYPRALVKIWNDWWRDENLQDEFELYTGDNDEYADEFAFDLLDPDIPLKSCKYHNRYTTALPRPVKGPDVLIPMKDLQVGASANSDGVLSSNIFPGLFAGTSASAGDFKQFDIISVGDSFSGSKVVANNVSNTIRMLRLATQTELLLARDARGGTRYVESLLSHWHVHNGDARLQRSEYLGSRQIPLSVFQITNTSQNSDGVLGNVGGQSVTKDAGLMFNKAFSEYGVVVGLATVRTSISYGSGRRKQFTRKGRFDFIWPEFKHVGDVELKTTELDQSYGLIEELTWDDDVLGYTPYGSELREGYNANTGLFRAKASGSLSYLTYQVSYDPDDYPKLGADYIKQSKVPVANTLVSQEGPQYYALFKFEETQIIPLDPTSDPGLMDHF